MFDGLIQCGAVYESVENSRAGPEMSYRIPDFPRPSALAIDVPSNEELNPWPSSFFAFLLRFEPNYWTIKSYAHTTIVAEFGNVFISDLLVSSSVVGPELSLRVFVDGKTCPTGSGELKPRGIFWDKPDDDWLRESLLPPVNDFPIVIQVKQSFGASECEQTEIFGFF